MVFIHQFMGNVHPKSTFKRTLFKAIMAPNTFIIMYLHSKLSTELITAPINYYNLVQ